MNQRFYIRNYGDYDRWYVFMGNKAMEEAGAGVKVTETKHREVAESTVTEYTQVFNRMVADQQTTPKPQQRY